MLVALPGAAFSLHITRSQVLFHELLWGNPEPVSVLLDPRLMDSCFGVKQVPRHRVDGLVAGAVRASGRVPLRELAVDVAGLLKQLGNLL